MEEIIRSKILRNSRSAMIQSQVMAIQKARYGFDENEVNIENIGKSLNNLNLTDFMPALENSTIASSPLFTLVGQTYTLKDLANFTKEKEILPNSNIGVFDAWYDRFTASKLNQAEEDDLLANNKEYQLLLNEYREGILLFSLMNEEVWQKGIQDTLGQINYFNQNIQNYQWKTRVNAYIIKILDANQLEPARSEVRGLPLDQELISKFENGLKTNKTLAFQTESGFFEYENHPILSKANPNLPYQEIKSEGITHLVLLGEKIGVGPKKFEDTRGLVIRDYQNHLETKLLENLTKKYPVIINPRVKEEVFASLNQL
jgi:peptidyl-prolyl cis-trans isomerase SurA